MEDKPTSMLLQFLRIVLPSWLSSPAFIFLVSARIAMLCADFYLILLTSTWIEYYRAARVDAIPIIPTMLPLVLSTIVIPLLIFAVPFDLIDRPLFPLYPPRSAVFNPLRRVCNLNTRQLSRRSFSESAFLNFDGATENSGE